MEEKYIKTRFLNKRIYLKTRQGNQYSIDVVFIGEGIIEGLDKFGSVVIINISDIEIIEEKNGQGGQK